MIKNDSKALKIVLLVLAVAFLFTGITCRTCTGFSGRSRSAESLSLDGINEIEIEGAPGSAPLLIEGTDGLSSFEGWVKSAHKSGNTLEITMGPKPLTIRIGDDGRIREIEAKTVSGSITVSGVRGLDDLETESVSGRIDAENLAVTNEFTAHTTSGKIEIDNITAAEVDVASTSGKIDLNAEASSIMKIDTVSGSVKAYTGMTDELEIHTISGSATIHTERSNPYVDFDSLSGTLSIDGADRSRGNDAEIKAKTISGSISITAGI